MEDYQDADGYQRAGRFKKKSIYNPVLYGKSILHAVMGLCEPSPNPEHHSLMHVSAVPPLVKKIKELCLLIHVRIDDICPSKMRKILKKLQMGKFYRYSAYLCKQVNPNFEFLSLTPADMDRILVCYRNMTTHFRLFKDKFNKTFNVQRKSLPHIGTLLDVIFENLNLKHLASYLPRMQSRKRQMKIRRMAEYLFHQANSNEKSCMPQIL